MLVLSCAEKVDGEPTADNCNINTHELLITEVYRSNNAEEQHWIEIYNPSDRTIQLNRAFISTNNHEMPLLGDIKISPDSYFVIGNRYTTQPDYLIDNLQIRNKTGVISLQCKDTLITSVNYKITKNQQFSYALDQIRLEQKSLDTSGWCMQNPISPGETNATCDTARCSDETNEHAMLDINTPQITFQELLVYPAGENIDRQWITLKIQSEELIDLNSLTIEQKSLTDNTSREWQIDSTDCLLLEDSLLRLLLSNSPEQKFQPAKFSLATGPKLLNQSSLLTVSYKNIVLDQLTLEQTASGRRQTRCLDSAETIGSLCNGQQVFYLSENNRLLPVANTANTQEMEKETCETTPFNQTQWLKLQERIHFSETMQDENAKSYLTFYLETLTPVTLNLNQLAKILDHHIFDEPIEKSANNLTHCLFIHPGEYITIQFTD